MTNSGTGPARDPSTRRRLISASQHFRS